MYMYKITEKLIAKFSTEQGSLSAASNHISE